MIKCQKISKGKFWFTLMLSMIFAGLANATTMFFSGPSGGYGGNYFKDPVSIEYQNLIEIRVRSGAYIDSIQTVYNDRMGQGRYVKSQNGGNGGQLSVFKLQPGEYITRISGKYGAFVDSLTVYTSKGRQKRWGGTGGNAHYNYVAPPGTKIHGFFGRSGKFVDAIGVIYKIR